VTALTPDLFSLAFNITLATFIQLAAAVGVSFFLRQSFFEGLAVGLAVIAAGFGSALYAASALGTPVWTFVVGGTAVTTFFISLMRLTVFKTRPSRRPTIFPVWLAIAVIAIVIMVVRLMTPEPQAGYSIYQAWNPLYLDASFAADRFIDVEKTSIGAGFLGATMLYPIDMLGLSAVTAYVFGFSSHAANLGSSIAAVIGAFSILAYGLRRSSWAVFLFCGLFLCAWRFSPIFAFPTADNSNDHLIYLGGAIALYYLCCGPAGAAARRGSAVLLSMSAIARPYGAAYAAVVGLMTFSRDLIDSPRIRTLVQWIPVAVIATICAARELYLLINFGAFAARSTMAEIAPPSLEKSISGIVRDLGIVPAEQIFRFPFPVILLSLAALIAFAIVWRKRLMRRPGILLIILAPTVLLLAPVLVELATGYRKTYAGSKLYFVGLFFFAWYPCWLLSRIKALQAFPPFIRKAATVAGICLMVGSGITAAWKVDSIKAWYAWAVGTYRANNTDRAMALAIQDAASSPSEMKSIAERSILYTYYEPGLGIRYFMGGALTGDFDLWGDKVQSMLDQGKSLASTLEALGWPNVYISYPKYTEGYGRWMPGEGWHRIKEEMAALMTSDRVQQVVTSGDAQFIIFKRLPE